MTARGSFAHDPDRPTLADQIEEAWALLEAKGAVAHRVPLSPLSRWEAELLLTHERRRLRALMERYAPDPQPFNWRKYRLTQVRSRVVVCTAATAAHLRREAA